MIFVYFKVCDLNGIFVNILDVWIYIFVFGEGSLIGDGIECIGINFQLVEGGVGYVLI